MTRKGSCPGGWLLALILMHRCAPLASLYLTESGYGFAGESGKHPKINGTGVFITTCFALLEKLQSSHQSVPSAFSVSAALLTFCRDRRWCVLEHPA